MSLFGVSELPPPQEVTTTAAMRVALYCGTPILVATLGEISLSLFPDMASQEWLVAATFLGAMLSWIFALPLIGAAFWASLQEHLAAKSKLILWVAVLVALALTLIIPRRVVDKKYYVWNSTDERPHASGSVGALGRGGAA